MTDTTTTETVRPRLDPSIIHSAKLGMGLLREHLQHMLSEGWAEEEPALEATWLAAQISNIIDEALDNAEAAS